ncbi:NACHT, LRR and PYD domains-containing protein 14-like [Halichondria panicea]|uniref:NACHT, LRR and PYD domains-containing protein 14-like n=1 Tax=Halichondria panicea TaxID=6063 RepID=UPI00312B2C2E
MNAMDQSQSTQEEQENEQPQQERSHSVSAQHTTTSPLIVSIADSIREQHINETASNDTQFSADTPSQLIVSIPYPIRAQRNTRLKKPIVSIPYPLTSPLIVSIAREQHINETASNDTRISADTPSQLIVSIPYQIRTQRDTRLNVSIPYPLKEKNSEREISKQSHSTLARKRFSTRSKRKNCKPNSNLKGATSTDIPRVHLDNPQQLAGSSRQYESDDSDSTFIQQYESDSSQQCDGECSKTDDDTRQHHLIASCSSQTMLDFNKIYETLFEARAKWYNLGLALGLDIGTLDSIKHNNKECEDCLREALKQRDNTTKLTWTEIIKALRNLIVGKHQLANKIQTKYAPECMSQSSSQPSSEPTPECVVRYASFLKDKYKQMPTFPDDWPPPLKKKFTKLALIERERKKQICLPQAKHTQSIEYDYAIGNVDNIVERKQTTTLEKIFQPLPSDSTPNRYIVVMDGAPGVGKTTLSRKICIDWAQGKLLKDHHIVILKPLRELNGHTAVSLTDILKADDPRLRKQIVKYIQETSGLGVMFIFDGFDELSSEQQRSDKETIFWEIIRGNCLHNCSVLVTSRSYASRPLENINRVNRHVEVLGFKRKDIERCIKENITVKEKSEKLIQMLKDRLDIVSLCYIPLNCRIVLYVYQQQGTLPDTLTQLYEVFILYTVKHYKPDINEIQYANNIEDFPATIIDCLDSLCELAYTGMTQDKLVFKYKEVTQEFDTPTLSLGLLNLIETFNKKQTKAYYYQFLHLTIQEFLAARHLALTKSNKDKLEFIKSKFGDDRFRMTLLFLSGLTQLDFLPIEQTFPDPKSIDTGGEHKYKTQTRSLRKQDRSQFLFLAHLLYESCQTTYNWLLPCLVTNSLNLSGQSLSQFDCLLLANFLALTSKDHVWDEIKLSKCSLSTEKIELLLSKKHSERDISVLCLTKQLDICSDARISQTSFSLLFEKDSKLENVYAPCLKFEEKVCCISPLGEALLRTQSLQELKMGSDRQRIRTDVITKSELWISETQICSGMIQKLFEFIQLEKVKIIALCNPDGFEDCSQCASSGSDAWESLCYVIKNSKKIKLIKINKSQFNAHDISSLMAALQNKRNLQTLQIPGSKISHEGLIHFRNNMPVNVLAHIGSFNYQTNLTTLIHKDKYVCVSIGPLPHDIKFYDDNDVMHLAQSTDLFTPLLEGDLPPELHGVTVSTKSFMSKALLRSVGNSKIVTSLTVANLFDEQFTKFAGDFRDKLKETKSLQTLKLDLCGLNDTSIKHLEDGLSLNEAVALKLDYEYTLNNALKVRSQNLHELNVEVCILSEEDMRQLLEIVTKCKQLQVLKVCLEDNSESFFHALSDNQNLRELSIHTTSKMSVLLFQTLPSTSITTLDFAVLKEVLGNEGSLAFKEFIHRNKVLTVLRVNRCGLTNEAFRGITFTHESPLRELYFGLYISVDKGWAELFNALCSSRITTLDISGNKLYGEECCTALNCLLLKNETLIVLRISQLCNNEMVRCIADALSQNCSLGELKIGTYGLSIQGWIKLFESLYKNTRLETLHCINTQRKKKKNLKIAKSLCEMLKHNRDLQNLNIDDELIECNLKEFAIAYIQRKPVLNLTVRKLQEQLENEIEELEYTDKEYNIQNSV